MSRLAARLVASLSLASTLVGCAAEDAGTVCREDYHCISGSCTFGTCDAFPSCWPDCGEQHENAPDKQPAASMRDAAQPMFDPAPCKLRLCAELSLAECQGEPGCEVSPRCTDGGFAHGSWRSPFADGGPARTCMSTERCLSSWGSSDVRIHPLNSCF